MDKDGNNKVSYFELKNYLISFGFSLSDETVKDMMRSADTDRDGAVDFKEFVRVVKGAESSYASRGWIHLKAAIQKNVSSHPPKPEKRGLKRTLTLTEPPMTAAERKVFSEIYCEMDVNNDGGVSYFELKNKMAAWGFDFSETNIRNMMREADIDGDAKITFAEFVRVCHQAKHYFNGSHWRGPYMRMANKIAAAERRRR
jgi:calmodulin